MRSTVLPLALGLAAVACRSSLLDHGGPASGASILAPLWPMPGHDAQHRARAEHVGPATPRLRWTSPWLLQKYSHQIAVGADGTLYTLDEIGGNDVLLVVDGETGSIRTRLDLGRADPAPVGPPRLRDVVLGPDGTVYAPGESTLTAFDASLHARWSLPCAADSGALIVTDDVVYAGCRLGDYGGELVSIAIRDGSVRWRTPVSPCGRGSLYALASDGSPIVCSMEQAEGGARGPAIAALDAGDGRRRWTNRDFSIATPSWMSVANDGTIYDAYGTRNSESALAALRSSDGTSAWPTPFDHPVTGAMAVAPDDTLVVLSSGRPDLLAFRSSGEVRTVDPGLSPAVQLVAINIDAAGSMFVSSGGNLQPPCPYRRTSGLQAIDAGGSVRWQIEVQGWLYSFVLGDGVIYGATVVGDNCEARLVAVGD